MRTFDFGYPMIPSFVLVGCNFEQGAHCTYTHAFGSCKVNDMLFPCIVCNIQKRWGQWNAPP